MKKDIKTYLKELKEDDYSRSYDVLNKNIWNEDKIEDLLLPMEELLNENVMNKDIYDEVFEHRLYILQRVWEFIRCTKIRI